MTHGELLACLLPAWRYKCSGGDVRPSPEWGWGFVGIADKNSEVTILLKCQSQVLASLKRLPRLLNRKKETPLSSLLQKACSETGRDNPCPSLGSKKVLHRLM